MSTEIDAEIVATCEAAATYLGEHGLARSSYFTIKGQACAAGALLLGHYAGKTEHLFDHGSIVRGLRDCPAIPAVADVIRERYPSRLRVAATGEDERVIYAFNDNLHTTQDEVIEVLRETIRRHTPDAYTSTPEEQP